MKSSILTYALAVLVIPTICGTLPAMGSDDTPKPVYSVTDLKVEKNSEGRESSRAIPFEDNHDQVSVTLPDGTHKVIHVDLKTTTYEGTLVAQTDSRMTTKHGAWFCFELQSKDKDVPYNWYIWLGNPAGRFKLFTTPDGNTYLTWVDFSTLCFADISKPMDQTKKMNGPDNLVKRSMVGVQHVEVGGIIGQESFIDENTTAHYYSIYLTSFEKDGNGGFKLQLHGKDFSKIYTLVTDKAAKLGWSLVE